MIVNSPQIIDEHDGYRFYWVCEIRPDSTKPLAQNQRSMCGTCHQRGYLTVEDSYGCESERISCPSCNGTGYVAPFYSSLWAPPPPKGFIDHMEAALKSYWNQYENDNFKLT